MRSPQSTSSAPAASQSVSPQVSDAGAAGRVPADEARLLGVIVELVRQSTQIDVSHYKDSTFRRQLDRRMAELGVSDLSAYVALLERESAELLRLQQSLLISVTRFFRDPEVFQRLRQVLTNVVAHKADGEPLRLWVPGCATGEEAYTIAILVAEALGERLARVPVRLFATDIDQAAIQHARVGRYPTDALNDVPPELAARYFLADDAEHIRPIKAIRDMCVFAPHDLLSQPPFVNLDLVSCRNVLIYFQADVQSEILAKFHHALRPDSWLLLGQSESTGGAPGLYDAADKNIKLFARRNVPSPRLHDFVSQSRPLTLPPSAPMLGARVSQGLEARFHQQLLRRHVPPSVMVGLDGKVLHLWGALDPFLKVEGGPADFSLVGLCMPSLRHEVKAILHLAGASTSGDAVTQSLHITRGDRQTRVVLTAQKVGDDQGEPLGVVLSFEEQALPPRPEGESAPFELERRALNEELAAAREHLQSLVQQVEQGRQERQSLHEELQASSEELQSSNEELQASNEELTTLNEQLQSTSAELSDLNDVLLSIESSVQMAMVVVDQHLRVMRFNPLAVRIFGLLDHDVGRPLHSVPSSLPLGDLPQQVAGVLRSGEALVSRIDEHDRHYVMQISPLHDARGQLAGVILAFTDVADLRAAEMERSRLAAIVTSSQDAIVGKTLDGIVTSWNPAAERLFGYSADEMIGQPMLKVFPPDRQHEEAHLLQAISRGEVVASFDTERLHRQGHRVQVSVSLSPILNSSGQVVGASKIARDISERKQIEHERQQAHAQLEQLVSERTAALADKERQLESILEGMPGMVAYWGADLRLKYANHEHRARLGSHDAQGGVGQTMLNLLGAERAAFARPHVDTVLQGQPAEFEVGPVTSPGRTGESWFQIQFVPDLKEGEVVGFIAMGFDITNVKHAEADAAAASQAKSEFLANMSHEIRTPLNAVLGLAQLGQRQHPHDPVAETFDHIVQAGHHLLGVINDVLDFSKIEAGKLDLQVGRVDVDELVDGVVNIVAEQARRKGLRLTISKDPSVPQAYAGDPVRLAQLLINLLTNAVKFTDEGSVELTLRTVPEGLSMVVSDTGPGMNSAMVARLFTPFERGDASTTRRVGGTGLGLSICKRLVELMSGTISVDTQVGRGSRFEVKVPLPILQTRVIHDPSSLTPMSTASLSPPQAGRLQGLRLLVAEDHPVNQLVLGQLLEVEGADMVLASHGGLAVEQVKAHPPAHFDLVLCDIEMPIMDGYEATRQIKAIRPELPVIGLTAHAFDDARQQGQAAGMTGYVTKPYMVDVLVEEIRRLVRPDRVRSLDARPPGDPEPSAPRLLDIDALQAHYGSMPDFLPRLYAAVRRTCEGQPAALSDALAQHDVPRLKQLAHSVAGMAANLLMHDLRAQARRLEVVADTNRQEAATLVTHISDVLHRLCAQLVENQTPPPDQPT